MVTRCHCCDKEICSGDNLAPGVLYQMSMFGEDMIWCDSECYSKDKITGRV